MSIVIALFPSRHPLTMGPNSPTPTTTSDTNSDCPPSAAWVYQGQRCKIRIFRRWARCSICVRTDNKLEWKCEESGNSFSIALVDTHVMYTGRTFIGFNLVYMFNLRTSPSVTVHRFAVPTRAARDAWLSKLRHSTHSKSTLH